MQMKEGQLQLLPGRSGETCRVPGQACLDPRPQHSLSWPCPWKRTGSSWPFRPILGSIRAERHETGQVHGMREKPGTYSWLLDQHFKRRFLEILTLCDPESLRAPRVHLCIKPSLSPLCPLVLLSRSRPLHLARGRQTTLGAWLKFFPFIKDIYFPITNEFLMQQKERKHTPKKAHTQKIKPEKSFVPLATSGCYC